jgi:hypothetical protein
VEAVERMSRAHQTANGNDGIALGSRLWPQSGHAVAALVVVALPKGGSAPPKGAEAPGRCAAREECMPNECTAPLRRASRTW